MTRTSAGMNRIADAGSPGMSYQVADNAEPHRSSTAIGAKLFVVA